MQNFENKLIKVDGSAEDISLFEGTNTSLINPEQFKEYKI